MVRSIYEAVGGSAGVLALAHAWHERCLNDPVVSHAFSHPGQHPGHIERLAAYWGEAWGGPADYSRSMGSELHVVLLHSGNGIHQEMDRRAIECFVAALDDSGVPDEFELRRTLTDYFRWSTAALAEHPESADDVPESVTIPRWSWNGSVT